ncbi:uncharacterized protein LOC124358141 [Homalodisca vitripennis]|uniref:uncharacterized protein LOC124358141 n=1 Tax=Homalodisca vitripennis TaxID=197043 RepID=UPI001EEB5C55|nr:uncharacterized protein LOC124358141 [Homalodisca vitripennis]
MLQEAFEKEYISRYHCESDIRNLLSNPQKHASCCIKAKLRVFFDARGIIHIEFLPQRQTANAAIYLEVFKRLKRRVVRVRPEIKEVLQFHHNNISSHMLFVSINYQTQIKTSIVPQILNSPDLALREFYLFFQLKSELKEEHCVSVENAKAHVRRFLRDIPVQVFFPGVSESSQQVY